MCKILFSLFSFIFLLSCNNLKENTEKEFYNNGDLKAVHIIRNGIKSDSSIYYYPNNGIAKIIHYLEKDTTFEKDFSEKSKLLSVGKNVKNRMIGKWKFYKVNGKLDKIVEYINLCGRQYTNQGWYFDEKGDTLKKYGNYFDFKWSSKIIKKNQVVSLQMTYKPIIYLNSEVELCLDTEKKVSKDFCNIHKVKLAKFYKSSDVLETYFKFETSGKKNIRGYIREFFNREETEQDSITSGERYLYFDIPVEIKN